MNIFSCFSKMLPIPFSKRMVTGIITLMISLIYTRLLNRPSPRGPVFVTWLPTFDCNAFCRFCGTHTLHKKQPENLNLERCLEIANEIGRSKTWVVGFTGGEVLLWPHLFSVIRELKKYDIVIYIVTNGLLLKDYASEILSTKVDLVVVSIDSDSADEHDEVRQLPGLYDKALKGVKYLRKKRKNKIPLIKSTTVVSAKNLHKLKEVLRHLDNITDETSFQPVVGEYADHPHSRDDKQLEKFFFSDDLESTVKSQLDGLIADHPEYNKGYFKLIPEYWFHPEKLIERIKCWSPFLRLQIMPGGETRQCTVRSNYGATGNLNSTSIMDAWNSEEMQRQREEIRCHRNACICWTQDTAFNATLDEFRLDKVFPVFQARRKPSEKK
jgi:MoaA/NifB/PqqE/SkfB family radical SAM enzyme